MTFIAAVVQQPVEASIDEAKRRGASLVVYPEGFAAPRGTGLWIASEAGLIAPDGSVTTEVAEAPFAKIGFARELSSPERFRSLAAEVVALPSSLILRDRWEVLLRARAIENLCYVLAAGAGRSTIVDPWGTVLATAADRASVIFAELDIPYLHGLRAKLPCLQHLRPEAYRF